MMEHTISEKLFGQIRDCTKLMLRLAHSEHRYFNPDDRQRGIGRGQGLVLRILAENDGLSQMELAEKLDIRPSSLGELVAKLEESGHVERRPNENDKRVMNVYLTEKGREAVNAFVNPRQKAADEWCAGMSDEEKEQLSGLLDKMIASMQGALENNDEDFPGGGQHFGGFHGMARDEWTHRGPYCHHGYFGRGCEGPKGFGF